MHYYVFRAYSCVHYYRQSAKNRFVSAFALHVQNLDVIYKRHHHPAKANEKALWFLNNPYYRNKRLCFALFILIWIALFVLLSIQAIISFFVFSNRHVFLIGKPAGSLQSLLSIRALWSSYIAVLWLNPGTGASVSKTVEWELKWKKPVGSLIMNKSFFKTQNRARSRNQRPNVFVFVTLPCFVISTRQDSLSWSMRGEITSVPADSPTMCTSPRPDLWGNE